MLHTTSIKNPVKTSNQVKRKSNEGQIGAFRGNTNHSIHINVAKPHILLKYN